MRSYAHFGRRAGQRLGLLAATGLGVVTLGLAAPAAHAGVVCDPGGDHCVVVPDTVQTPLGPATITVSPANVVTVHLVATSRTLVVGVPFQIPPGPPGIPGYARTSIATSAGVVDIDTIQIPPGPPGRVALPNLAVVSILPPGPPCRAHTSGETVTFTPVALPGSPG